MKRIVEYVRWKNQERLNRRRQKARSRETEEFVRQSGGGKLVSFFRELHSYQAPGDLYEEVMPEKSDDDFRALVVAFYLPQFHAIPENDRWWGRGFTEWRNTSRGVPRFRGHYQPRIPRDLGFYDVTTSGVLHRQVEMARAGGVQAFCFHYYNFDGRRILERPLEDFLADPSLDLGFCINWANENWTRRWDGEENDVLLRQSYAEEFERDFAVDVCRHFKDSRYVRVGGRPLFIIYRPAIIPDARGRVERFRAHCRDDHGEDPFIVMVQWTGQEDPVSMGFDGAIEFPPHKLARGMDNISVDELYDPEFQGHYCSYDELVARSVEVTAPEFPLIRTVVPNWDNEARKPGRGFGFVGSTPRKYEQWLHHAIDHACAHPVVPGCPMVFVNAWNEWAEGAYLEPDVHFGHAYLNATRRAALGRISVDHRGGILLIGHDASQHGAQMLLLHVGKMLKSRFGVTVRFLLLGDGDLLREYRSVADTEVVSPNWALDSALARLGITSSSVGDWVALTNTVVSGSIVPDLKARRMRVVSLVHELGHLIRERGLEAQAKQLAQLSDVVVFPSHVVSHAFDTVCNVSPRHAVVQPQGIYQDLSRVSSSPAQIRRELGIPDGAKLVVNVGYADLRKGFDLFVELSKRTDRFGEHVHFVWVGRTDRQLMHWVEADPVVSGGQGRVRIIDFTEHVLDYVGAADVFALTSREDPFPSVALEALALGVPVVAFAETGGVSDMLAEPGCGLLVDKFDVGGMAQAVFDLIERDSEQARSHRAVSARGRYDMGEYVFFLLRLCRPALQKVSVVITNYNHERYLEERLRSVFAQTYPLYEIRFHDDASSDQSVEKVRALSQAYGREVTMVASKANTGSAFGQWPDAVRACSGEFVWIAEADDSCASEFVEWLVEGCSGSTTLAFSDSTQVGERGEPLAGSYRYYYHEHWPGEFDADIAVPGREFLRKYLSVLNCILNVSSVLFRRSDLLRVLDEHSQQMRSFRLAGDWYLYATLLARADSGICYRAKALNVHRRHAGGVTESLAVDRHVDEIARVQRSVAETLGPDEDLQERQRRYLTDVEAQLRART